jgi:hypothetical protein
MDEDTTTKEGLPQTVAIDYQALMKELFAGLRPPKEDPAPALWEHAVLTFTRAHGRIEDAAEVAQKAITYANAIVAGYKAYKAAFPAPEEPAE